MKLFSSKQRNNIDSRFVDIDKMSSKIAKLISSALKIFKSKKTKITSNDKHYRYILELNKHKLIDSILISGKNHYKIVDFLGTRAVQRGSTGVRHKFIYAAVRIL